MGAPVQPARTHQVTTAAVEACEQHEPICSVVLYALAGRRPGCTFEPNSDAVIPEARCRAARQCLEGSESRNRLGGGTHLAGFFSFCKGNGRLVRDCLVSLHIAEVAMSVVRKQSWFVACCLALGAAACGGNEKGTPTGPGGVTLKDPAATTAQLQAIAATFTT